MTEISTDYARNILDLLVGMPNDTLRSVNGKITDKQPNPATYHESMFSVSVPKGVTVSDSRSLSKYGCDDGATFERMGQNKTNTTQTTITVDTDKGKIGFTITYR
jgi:hypothetical protein